MNSNRMFTDDGIFVIILPAVGCTSIASSALIVGHLCINAGNIPQKFGWQYLPQLFDTLITSMKLNLHKKHDVLEQRNSTGGIVLLTPSLF